MKSSTHRVFRPKRNDENQFRINALHGHQPSEIREQFRHNSLFGVSRAQSRLSSDFGNVFPRNWFDFDSVDIRCGQMYHCIVVTTFAEDSDFGRDSLGSGERFSRGVFLQLRLPRHIPAKFCLNKDEELARGFDFDIGCTGIIFGVLQANLLRSPEWAEYSAPCGRGL